MEIELKYAVPNEDLADAIWEDEEIRAIEQDGSRSSETYYGLYYDTEEGILAGNGIVFRIRREGRPVVATLKWNAQNSGALSLKEEVNVPLGSAFPDEVGPEIFAEHEACGEVLEILKGEKLIPGILVDVSRRSLRVETGSSLIEISIDIGVIKAAGGEEAVLEAEFELLGGSQEEMLDLAATLVQKYGLKPETRSKFQRGLMLKDKN